jgi:hypothetical protein
MTVRPGRRRAFVRKAITRRWSRRQIDAALRSRYGNRGPHQVVGRKPRIVKDPAGLPYELLSLVQRWQHFMQAVDAVDKTTGRSLEQSLTSAQQKMLRQIQGPIAALGKALARRFS